MSEANYVVEVAERIRASIDPEKLPAQGLDQLFGSYALLALSKGKDVTNEDVHDAWSVWASEFDPDNDSIVPYADLTEDVQAEDTVFRDAIRRVASEL